MQSWWLLAMYVDEDAVDAVLGPLILLGVLVALTWFGYRRWRLRYRATRWTMTEATIQSEFAANANSPRMSAALGGVAGAAASSSAWNAVLQYSYLVAGEFYAGYFMLGGTYWPREDASTAARPWIDKKIFVRYNPDRPHESAFLKQDGAPKGSRSLGDQPPASPDVITLSLR
jgi:hypothetical protein